MNEYEIEKAIRDGGYTEYQRNIIKCFLLRNGLLSNTKLEEVRNIRRDLRPSPKKVIYNGPATIVIFEDGSKTVVKLQEGETMDREKAVYAAICKRMFGSNKNRSNWLDILKPLMKSADEALRVKSEKDALNDGYFAKLRNEYKYLAHKFNLTPMDYRQWRFLRLRPQNFPHIRISQLAHLYYQRKAGLSQLVEAASVEDAKKVLATAVTPYWETHYTFGSTSVRNDKNLSPFSLNLLCINTVVPILFAYGRHRGEEKYCDRAFDFLEQLRPENNYIIRLWQQSGLVVDNAGDSQALIQLKKEYCDKKECLRCRFGYEYLKL